MDDKDKRKVYEKFKERSDEKVIKNQGMTFNYGNTEMTIKELAWDDADKLEDKIIELIKQVQNMFKTQLDDENMAETLVKSDIASIIGTFRDVLLKQGLLDLAKIISNGQITKKSISESKATKSQVIKIVTEGLLLNYSYIKNLIPLAGVFKK